MIRRPPRSTRTDTLFPYTTLFRSVASLMCPLSRRVRITCSSRVKRRFMKVSLGLLGLVLPPPSAGVEARAGLADARHVAVSEEFRFRVLDVEAGDERLQ